jgi:hypothetical protein
MKPESIETFTEQVRVETIDPSPLSPFLNVLVVGLGYHLGTNG